MSGLGPGAYAKAAGGKLSKPMREMLKVIASGLPFATKREDLSSRTLRALEERGLVGVPSSRSAFDKRGSGDGYVMLTRAGFCYWSLMMEKS